MRKMKKYAAQASGEEPKEHPLVKEYLVLWKNQTPDSENLMRVKTTFRCDVKLLDSFLLTLPSDEREIICVTDENERLSKEARISYLKSELERLINNTPEPDKNENELDDEMADCEAPCDSYDRGYYKTEYYTSVTYYTKDGKVTNNFYDKEEVRRFSTRSLMITGLIDDYAEKPAN